MNNMEPAEIVNLFWMPLGETVGQHNGKSKIDKRGWEKLNGAYGKRVGKYIRAVADACNWKSDQRNVRMLTDDFQVGTI